MENGHVHYYYESLVPHYESYLTIYQQRQNKVGSAQLREAALLSCQSLFHFRDQIKPAIGEHFSRNFVGDLIGSDYHLIGDVFNAKKHRTLERKDKLIKDYSSIVDGIYVTRFIDELGTYSCTRATLLAKTIKGETIDLLRPATEVYNFWTRFLTERGDINTPVYHHYVGDDLLPRSEADSDETGRTPFGFDMAKGLPYKDFELIVRSYDHENGQMSRPQTSSSKR